MKKVTKWIVTVIVLVFVIGVVWLCARINKSTQAQNEYGEDRADVSFEGRNIELNGVEGSVCSYIHRCGKLYMLAKKNDKSKDEYILYIKDIEEDNVRYMFTFEDENIITFCIDDNENVVYMSEKENEDKHTTELVKTDIGGNEIARTDLREIVGGDDLLICGLLIDLDNQLVLACKHNIYFLDENIQLKDKMATKQDILVDIALAKSGQLVCVTDQENSEEISLRVHLLDTKQKQWGEDVAVKLDATLPNDYIIDGVDCDFYYKSGDGIYAYDIVDRKQKEIIDYNASYMVNSDTEDMIAVGNGKFIGKTEHFTDNEKNITLVSYEKKDENKINKKQKITLGTVYPGNNVKSAVAKFNRSNSEYEVVIVDYSEMEMERLLADLSTGKGQDIIDMGAFPLSVANCVSKGMLEDLTGYFENDAELSTDDLLEPVRKAMEINGKMYYVSSDFSVSTVAARKADVGDCEGWSVQELKAVVDEKGEEKDLFSLKDTKDGYLASLISDNLYDYVDWEKGNCSFDGESFKYILQLCNEKGLEDEKEMDDSYEEVDSQYSRFKKGEFLLLEEDELDLKMIQFERQIFGSEIKYVGYPNAAEKGAKFSLSNRFAISSQSKNKEQAWEFIRTMLLKEYQKNIEYSMPIMKDMFDAKMKELTATEAYINEFGEMVNPVEEYTMEWGEEKAEISVPTQEDVDTYMNIINNTKYCTDYDYAIENIVMEDAQDYFKGRKKLDKTVEIIQDRVTKYINEQK